MLVEPGARLDPACEAMRDSPLVPAPGLPGVRILGFVACATVVRRAALLEAGGFEDRMGFGGEEDLLAYDLATAGWGLAYSDEVVAHHAPEARGHRPARSAREVRNALWTAWLRRPAPRALRISARVAAVVPRDRAAACGLLQAARGLGWTLRERRVVPPHVEAHLRVLEAGHPSSRAL